MLVYAIASAFQRVALNLAYCVEFGISEGATSLGSTKPRAFYNPQEASPKPGLVS